MNIHCLQHVPFEGLGSISPWIQVNGHRLTWTRFHKGEMCPPVDDIDWLIVLGGPMNVYQEAEYPWLRMEKHLIEQALKKTKTVLGICMGAQLIADVLGAGIRSNRFREIGWFPVEKTDISTAVPLAAFLPKQLEVFHWHGDTFDLPDGTVRLAGSAACENQGFIYRDRLIALQFHLETTPQAARALIDHSREDLAAGPFVQTPAAMLSNPKRFDRINSAMTDLLESLSGLHHREAV
jgi:GMP synthase (glutamine-hydrolysing)